MIKSRRLFLFIFALFNNNFEIKIVAFIGIQTRVVRVEGKHVDHLTTTTTKNLFVGLVLQGSVDPFKPLRIYALRYLRWKGYFSMHLIHKSLKTSPG